MHIRHYMGLMQMRRYMAHADKPKCTVNLLINCRFSNERKIAKHGFPILRVISEMHIRMMHSEHNWP